MEMFTRYEEQVLFFFDQCPTREQIRSMVKMYKVPQKDIIAILKSAGREIPDKPKVPAKKEDPLDENQNKIPECVKITVKKRIDELTEDIKNYQDMLDRLTAELAAHVNYLEGRPFEQRNLSHGSVDTFESPQPKG